jgi:hypothetical protein
LKAWQIYVSKSILIKPLNPRYGGEQSRQVSENKTGAWNARCFCGGNAMLESLLSSRSRHGVNEENQINECEIK